MLPKHSADGSYRAFWGFEVIEQCHHFVDALGGIPLADAGIFFYYGFHSGTNMGEADKIAEALSAGRIADEMRSVDVNDGEVVCAIFADMVQDVAEVYVAVHKSLFVHLDDELCE